MEIEEIKKYIGKYVVMTITLAGGHQWRRSGVILQIKPSGMVQMVVCKDERGEVGGTLRAGDWSYMRHCYIEVNYEAEGKCSERIL